MGEHYEDVLVHMHRWALVPNGLEPYGRRVARGLQHVWQWQAWPQSTILPLCGTVAVTVSYGI